MVVGGGGLALGGGGCLRGQAAEARVVNSKSGPLSKSGPKKLEDLEAEGKLAMDRLEDIANYMGDYRDIVEEYAVSGARDFLRQQLWTRT